MGTRATPHLCVVPCLCTKPETHNDVSTDVYWTGDMHGSIQRSTPTHLPLRRGFRCALPLRDDASFSGELR